MHVLVVVALVLGATADAELSSWVEAGREVPDADVGRYAKEIVNQVAEFTVMSRVRGLQDALTQSQLDEQATALAVLGADSTQPLEVRRRAWFASCHYQRSVTVPALVAASVEGPLQLRLATTMCLGRFGTYNLRFHRELQKGQVRHVEFAPHFNAQAHEAALALAEAKEPEVRDRAWQALSHFDSPQLMPLVRRRMKAGEASPAFFSLLEPVSSREVTAYLLRFATSSKLEVRKAVAAVLAERSTQVPRAVFANFVADADDAVSTAGLEGLRWQLGLPLSLPQVSVDRKWLKSLITQRFSAGFQPAPVDKTMPAEVAKALELRAAGRSAEAADQLKQVAKKATDVRTAAIALHRAGDTYADDRDCNAAVDSYWQALVMHELRGDTYFAGVAANDLGLLWFKCTWHVGSAAPSLFEYVVALRRPAGDQEALRKAINNYSTSLIGLLLLDDAKPVVAEALALARELKDPVAERKAYTNEAYRQALYCTELVRLRVREAADGEGLVLPSQCERRADGSVWFTAEAERELRAVVAKAVELARQTNIDNATLCSTVGSPAAFICDWFPK